MRDHQQDYTAVDAVVLGISPDPVDAIKKFHERYSLNFPLLADADHKIAEEFGVWVKKSFIGKKYWGVSRSTFIIGPHQTIAHVIAKVSPKTHDQTVLEALKKIAV